MNSGAPDADFYPRFHQQLTDSQAWPGPYLFKFILKKDSKSREAIEQLFKNKKVKITTKPSSKGTYFSLSILTEMEHPDQVVALYKKIRQLQDVISL
jgi:putative lipoic acid-binding regulatory protein